MADQTREQAAEKGKSAGSSRRNRQSSSEESSSSSDSSLWGALSMSSSVSSLAPPFPPSSRTTSFSSAIRPTSPSKPSLDVISELRNDTSNAPPRWSNEEAMIKAAAAQELPVVEGQYTISSKAVHLKYNGDNIFLISNHHNRLFFWHADSRKLRYIETPYSLIGLYRALDMGQLPSTREIRPWLGLEATEDDVIPCPPQYKPKNWISEPQWVVADEGCYSLREYDLQDYQPILAFMAKAGGEDMNFFLCGSKYYIYRMEPEVLLEIVSPDMENKENWLKLESAPSLSGLQVTRNGRIDMLGGRPTIAEHDVPEGWEQRDTDLPIISEEWLLEDTDPHAIPFILSRKDGTAHLVEVGDGYRMWYPAENSMHQIHALGGLSEILKDMDDNNLPEMQQLSLGDL
ncbi:uncharacterized protein KY384_007982 [Bacidia gigantensis]|uniref:uncharacterized protein n=1 Tax=Bacidia gigantensis TaxID=2732470 RepID=UPI001D04C314|nr:uncharacterized protein KY384_007982 [Bacidia gigantensis]KAG8527238.1 hypothetical protein KY384_007982 [Bacidia gigantensis]